MIKNGKKEIKNAKIQEKLKTENITSNADIKLIETQIEEKMERLRKLSNIREISEYNKTIKNLLERKIATLGEINGATDELKELVKQRNSIDKQIRNSTKYISAPISGIVSYRVDGLEDVLSVNDFSTITKDFLENLELKTGKIVSTSNESGKIINNFKCYIATVLEPSTLSTTVS